VPKDKGQGAIDMFSVTTAAGGTPFGHEGKAREPGDSHVRAVVGEATEGAVLGLLSGEPGQAAFNGHALGVIDFGIRGGRGVMSFDGR